MSVSANCIAVPRPRISKMGFSNLYVTKTKKNDRSAHYDLFQSSIEVTLPTDYSSSKRKTVAEWHGLRLGTIPLNKFLHSISRHPDGQCECKTEVESVEHFLLRCPIHSDARTKLVREIKQSYNTRAPPSLARLLSTDSRSFKAMSTFLEEVTRFEPP